VTGAAASFFFDLQSPLAYLAAERVLHVLPGPAEWRPVLARELPGTERFECFRCAEEERIWRAEVQRRARELGLQPLRWPEPFPFDSEPAMRAATYAKSIGRTVAFAQAAFRQAFAGGRALHVPDNVLIAAAACEMHPTAVKSALRRAAPARELERQTARAAELGVREVPAVSVGERVFCGEAELELAAAYMRERTAAGRATANAPASAATVSA
jgi:2-hydroxychromene-2-carboxylate isomerase